MGNGNNRSKRKQKTKNTHRTETQNLPCNAKSTDTEIANSQPRTPSSCVSKLALRSKDDGLICDYKHQQPLPNDNNNISSCTINMNDTIIDNCMLIKSDTLRCCVSNVESLCHTFTDDSSSSHHRIKTCASSSTLSDGANSQVVDSLKEMNILLFRNDLRCFNERKNCYEEEVGVRVHSTCSGSENALGLFDALPQLVESNNSLLTAQLDIFFSNESNDNLVTGPSSNDQRHPIDLFHRAYLHVKRTTHCASLFLDLLEKIASMKPNPKRMMRAIQVLTQGHMRSIATQTDRVEICGDARSMPNNCHEIVKVCRSSQTVTINGGARMNLNHSSNDSNSTEFNENAQSTVIEEDAFKVNNLSPLAKVHSSPRSAMRVCTKEVNTNNYTKDIASVKENVMSDYANTNPYNSEQAALSLPSQPPLLSSFISSNNAQLVSSCSSTIPSESSLLSSARTPSADQPSAAVSVTASAPIPPTPPTSPSLTPALSPPPALLPPPPPPPPPSPAFLKSSPLSKMDPNFNSSTIFKSASVYKKKRSTNTINWEAVKPEILLAKTTVWNEQRVDDLDFNQYQRDFLERVFERAPPNGFPLRGRSLEESKKDHTLLHHLTEKRALNLGIVLARFRPDTASELISKLESHEATVELNVDYLTSLIKHFPTSDELSYFKRLSSSEDLRDAELFCYLAAQHPNLKLCVELRILAETVATDLSRQTQCARSILIASQELENHKGVILFLHRCLQFGNFLNQSTFAAGASGFALSSLLSTLNAKGRGKYERTRLIDIVAESADEKLRSVIPLIARIRPTRGCSVQELERWEKTFRASIENTCKRVNECGDEELLQRYSPLLMDSIIKCDHLAKILHEARLSERKLCVFYCAETFSIEAILDIFWNAFTLFDNAIKSAEEREVRFNRQRSLRAKAASDIHVLHASQRFERRRHTLGPPTVKDLIGIINSTQMG